MKQLTLALMFLPCVAEAAIQCQYHDEAVAAATVVVQITDPHIAAADTPGYCTITGTVQRSFRGDIALGSTLSTSTPCDTAPFPPGPQIVTAQSSLAAAPVIELHLTQGEVASYGAGLAVLPALTDAPARPPLCAS
jgi:hypothetical protein